MCQMVIPVDFDYLRRIIGAIIVISTSDTDIISSYQKLVDNIELLINNETATLNPYLKFATKNIYRYVVLIHDSRSVSNDKLEKDIAILKQLFFTGYFILSINNHNNDTSIVNLKSNPWFYNKFPNVFFNFHRLFSMISTLIILKI